MLSESTLIERTIDHVYGAFADIAGWRGVLPDVLDVRVLYDDGAHQEFLMTVERPAGPETVRGIRFCRAPYRIAMFQPAPPPGFRKMVGLWTFAEDDARRTRVTAARWFELDRRTGLDRVVVADKLRGYLRNNLDLFRRSLEARS